MREKIAGLYDFTSAKLVIQYNKSGEKACLSLSNSSTVLASFQSYSGHYLTNLIVIHGLKYSVKGT
jgi:hypothetical protein